MSESAAPAEPRPSSPPPDAITFTVKANNDTKYSLTLPPTTAIADVKAKLAELSDVPVDRQRLIYSGRVMKNDETLETYKVCSGNTVHLVKGAASNANPSSAGGRAAGSAAAAAAPGGGVPRNLAAGSGNNPLAGLTGARYAGHVQLPSADMFGPDGGMGPPPDAEGIAQAMSNPAFHAQMNEMLRDPQLLDYIISSNPVLQSMGPQARHLMQSDFFRQMITDPALIQQMSRMGAGAGLGGQAAAFPAPGVTDSTPAAAAAEPGQQPPSSQQPGTGQPPQQANPFASLFSQGAAPDAAGLNALLGMAYAAQGGSQSGSAPTADRPAPGNQNPILGEAAFEHMLRALGGAGAPGTGAGAEPGPGGAPADASGTAAAPNPFAGLFAAGLPPFGAGPAATATPPDTRPPEERFADELRQLNDMGFYDFDRNIEALRRSGGSVQGAVNQLLGG